MSGCPFIHISRMIRSLSSSLCALSSSSADVNTFMLSVRSNRRCRRADRSEVVSQSESESLESEDESAGRARFLAGGRWRGWQSVRQEIWITRAKSVRKRPKHTPQTKKSAALSGWSVMGEEDRKHVKLLIGSLWLMLDLFCFPLTRSAALLWNIFAWRLTDCHEHWLQTHGSYYSLSSLDLLEMSHKFC